MEFMMMSQWYYPHSSDKESRGTEGFTIISIAKARHLKIQLGVQQRRVSCISANHLAKSSPMAFWALQRETDSYRWFGASDPPQIRQQVSGRARDKTSGFQAPGPLVCSFY